MNTETNMQETTPLDDLIARVSSYIKNPKLVTPATLIEMQAELMDLKSVIDGDDREGMDDTPEEVQTYEEEKPAKLSKVVGKMRGDK